MVFIQFVCLVIILLIVPKSYASGCPNVTIDNECPIFGDDCYTASSEELNCKNGKVYHCGWNNSTKRFQEVCAIPVTCDIGKEPWMSANGVAKIECHYCHDQGYYNPYRRQSSSKYSKCEVKKDDCTSTIKFLCELNDETEKYTKNVRCRCDIRNGYIINRKYPEKNPACSYDHGLSCVKALCYPKQDILLEGYKCAPKCPSGYSRSIQTSDECFPVSTPTPSQTTTTTRPSLTTTKGSSTTTSSQSSPEDVILIVGVAGGIIFAVLVLLGCIVWQIRGSRQSWRRNGQTTVVEPPESILLRSKETDTDGIQPNPVQIFEHEDVPHDVTDRIVKCSDYNFMEEQFRSVAEHSAQSS